MNLELVFTVLHGSLEKGALTQKQGNSFGGAIHPPEATDVCAWWSGAVRVSFVCTARVVLPKVRVVLGCVCVVEHGDVTGEALAVQGAAHQL